MTTAAWRVAPGLGVDGETALSSSAPLGVGRTQGSVRN